VLAGIGEGFPVWGHHPGQWYPEAAYATQDSCGFGVLGQKPRASPWEGKKLVPRMVFIYENPIRKGR
jgi:hypothetical protein